MADYVAVAETPNGREIRRNQTTGRYEVQPYHDNYWIECCTLAEAFWAYDPALNPEWVIAAWQKARATLPDHELSSFEGDYAEAAGLPVLAQLHRLAAQLEKSPPVVDNAVVRLELSRIIHLANGEGTKRAMLCGFKLELPGLTIVPQQRLLEER